MPSLPLSSPLPRLRPLLRPLLRPRAYSIASKPHAYLTPFLSHPSLEFAGNTEGLQGVSCLVMDRPEVKNALSTRMVMEMRESIASVSEDKSARLLLLHTPHPAIFCAGADLRERRTMSSGQVAAFLDSLRSLLMEMEELRVPTIAVVDGFAMGGGCELALGCDLRVGGEHTKLALPETKLGIIPGAGGTQRLTHLVGAARAKELIFTGKRIDGSEAERIGLVNVCAKSPNTAMDEALLLCSQILTSAPLALAAAKSAITSAPHLPLPAGLDLERTLYDPLLLTEDRQEGLRAFAEKRTARFQGR
ncbi:hypothetical protein EHS25_003195 [Saitozyma podzolica]|uniref:Uncharacterized protein n=1 Tax=Saitozyma podzolica TaxID=1890683 RepID=A0A427Y867_9TREE|nr:hypothetical protein EHS25_003195 [Saitozyma podzolica]